MRAKKPVSISGIEFDALIESEETYEADVPEYPTEKGFNVSDTISIKPETLSMTLYITDTPVSWKATHAPAIGRTETVVKSLQEMFFKKQAVEITTTDKVYSSMAITHISIKKSAAAGYSREIPISFKKIVETTSKTTKIPDSYGRSGTTAASGGTANTSSGSSSGSSKSSSGSNKSSGSSSSSSSSSSSHHSSSSGSGSSGKSSSILYSGAKRFGLI